MNCVQRNCVYALIGLGMCFPGITATGRDNSKGDETIVKDKFQWQEHTRLSWDDFKGAVNATQDESAAATYCSIGFKTNTATPGSKPEIEVYNTFYTNRSWVRTDAHVQSILDHEQGHFDLCEIYTRKLKDRMSNFDPGTPGVKQALMEIYSEVSREYETRQQAYEDETIHGTNIPQQKRWQEEIANELIRQNRGSRV